MFYDDMFYNDMFPDSVMVYIYNDMFHEDMFCDDVFYDVMFCDVMFCDDMLYDDVILCSSKPQQYKIAKYCEDVLGDLLLTKPLTDFPVSTLTPPSDMLSSVGWPPGGHIKYLSL